MNDRNSRLNSDLFLATLRERVEQYFQQRGTSRKGNLVAYFKLFLFLSLLVGPYLLILFGGFSGITMFLLGLVSGLSGIFLIFNTGHDASHQALFRSRRLNKIASWSFYLVGANAYSWHITHDKIHHTLPNVTDTDSDIHRSAPLLRLSPTVPWLPVYRYQHIYALFLYPLNTLFFLFLKDFNDLGVIPKRNRVETLNIRHSPRVVITLILTKLFYLVWTLVIPALVLDVPFWKILGSFVLIHFSMGVLVSAILNPVHLVEETAYARQEDLPLVKQNWARHAFECTTDFAIHSPFACFMLGGLNIHVIHHLFPGICHVHYPRLMPLMMRTAEEFGITYRHQSWPRAMISHFRLLRNMGRNPEKSPPAIYSTFEQEERVHTYSEPAPLLKAGGNPN